MDEVFWVTASGVYVLNDSGSYIVFNGTSPFFNSITPEALQSRLLAGDPQGASSIVCSANPPVQAVVGAVWTGGDGNYHRWNGTEWALLPVALEDIFT